MHGITDQSDWDHWHFVFLNSKSIERDENDHIVMKWLLSVFIHWWSTIDCWNKKQNTNQEMEYYD